MMAAAAIFVALAVSTAPSVFTIPLPPNADVFLIDIDLDERGDIAVLDGFTLTVYPTANRNAPSRLALPPNARAFDVTALPGTRRIILLAACGSEIRQFEFGGNSQPEGVLLFEHASNLSGGMKPYRHVMVFERDGESLFFLPSSDSIELRTWSGELRERIEPRKVQGVRRFEEVGGQSDSTDTFGEDVLALHAHRESGNEPEFMTSNQEASTARERFSNSLYWSQFSHPSNPSDEWPWFALQPEAENAARVRCALRANPGETHIRIDTTLSNNGTIGPARKYPGMITHLNAELPDFNGDGYTDLLLWNADRPSVSVSTIARMAVRQDWPIRLTAHLYDPGSGRYVAKPFAALELRAALDALLRTVYRSPLLETVVDDLDGDGRTDLAFTADGQTYTLWLMKEDGARVEDVELREPIEGLAFAQSLDESGGVSIGLRTQRSLVLIEPR